MRRAYGDNAPVENALMSASNRGYSAFCTVLRAGRAADQVWNALIETLDRSISAFCTVQRACGGSAPVENALMSALDIGIVHFRTAVGIRHENWQGEKQGGKARK